MHEQCCTGSGSNILRLSFNYRLPLITYISGFVCQTPKYDQGFLVSHCGCQMMWKTSAQVAYVIRISPNSCHIPQTLLPSLEEGLGTTLPERKLCTTSDNYKSTQTVFQISVRESLQLEFKMMI